MIRRPPRSTLFPSTPLFRSRARPGLALSRRAHEPVVTQRAGGKRWRRLKSLGQNPLGRINRDGADPLIAIAVVERDGHLLIVEDRKSTRLNSSHLVISYAVF